MIRSSKLLLALVFGVALSPVSLQAQAPAQSQPAASKPKQSAGFVGYALDQFNPNDRDYVRAMAEVSGWLNRHTFEDVSFWSNVVSLIALRGVSVLCLLQSRSSAMKDGIVSTLIAQMWNGRVSDKQEIEKRTAGYNTIVGEHNLLAEQALRTRPSVRTQSTADEPSPKEVPAIEMTAPLPDPSLVKAIAKDIGGRKALPIEKLGTAKLFVRPADHLPSPPAMWQKTYKGPPTPKSPKRTADCPARRKLAQQARQQSQQTRPAEHKRPIGWTKRVLTRRAWKQITDK